MTNIFGTDGIRGVANQFPMLAETVLKIGRAVGTNFKTKKYNKAIIGKDTRLSGYMIEPALVAGLVSAGMDVVLAGPIPTPALAMLTRSLRASVGIMISGSHNQSCYNGIKLINSSGSKISLFEEMQIEELVKSENSGYQVPATDLGRVKRLEDAQGRYIEATKNTFSRGDNLSGLKIVIDCANGAGYKIAPTVLWELEAEVIPIAVNPNGFNINENCGSTSPELLRKTILENKADIGFALDGDADRIIVCDEKGNIIDGDQIIAVIADYYHHISTLQGNAVVATYLSNIALDGYLNNIGLELKRTQVGDRYVSEFMKKHNYNVGGEKSGHIIISDYNMTGDGTIAMLQVLRALKKFDKPASELCNKFTPLPQMFKNINCNRKIFNIDKILKEAICDAESSLGKDGRVLIRKSGTEPLIRLMVEGQHKIKVEKALKELSNIITHQQA